MTALPVRLEITERESPTFGGASFGNVGQYEKLSGWAWCEIDPAQAPNREIVNLDKAPRNARGMVEYRVQFCLLQPVEAARANGWLFFEVLNRGNKLLMRRVNNAPLEAEPN